MAAIDTFGPNLTALIVLGVLGVSLAVAAVAVFLDA